MEKYVEIFLSYHFADESFIRRISYYLSKQPGLFTYCFGDKQHKENWWEEVSGEMTKATVFLMFVGQKIGETQMREARMADEQKKKVLRILLPGANVPSELLLFKSDLTIDEKGLDEASAQQYAKRITEGLDRVWHNDDDLPNGYPFSYEKDIIDAYSQDEFPVELLAAGCPPTWSKVTKLLREEGAELTNPVPEQEIGVYRDWDYQKKEVKQPEPEVIAAALTGYQIERLLDRKITFPEAGPRKFIYYPSETNMQLKVGILVSGGIAPGINAVLAGIVERQYQYARLGGYEKTLTVQGCYNGFSAFFHRGNPFRDLKPEQVASLANQGGSMLGTSRESELMDADPARRNRSLEEIARRLDSNGIEILYVIGGDGSMRAAHALWHAARQINRELSVVAIPKTMDNDILWVWQSFGFLSAVERSKEAIQQLHTEAKSNPRLCVIQLFGSDSGFVVTHAVSASGVCDLFLIPEVRFNMKNVCAYITNKLKDRYIERGLEGTHGMIVMAETAIPEDARDYFAEVGLDPAEQTAIEHYLDNHRRIDGQTPDTLRSGGLKLVSRVIQQAISKMPNDYWKKFRVFTNEPRHLIRAIPPSSSDVIYARRLGSLAVDGAMAGYTDFMISQWLTEYVMVPLKLVTLGRKRVPNDGIFYKVARASTGQPVKLDGAES